MVLAGSVELPGLHGRHGEGMVGVEIRAGQVRGQHAGLVHLERHERAERFQWPRGISRFNLKLSVCLTERRTTTAAADVLSSEEKGKFVASILVGCFTLMCLLGRSCLLIGCC